MPNQRKRSRNKDRLLTAINRVTAYLLNSDNDTFDKCLYDAMKTLGKAVHVNRVNIWKNHEMRGRLYCSQVYEWSDESVVSGSDLVNEAYDEMEGVEAHLRAGGCINGIVSRMPVDYQKRLNLHKIVSILLVPVFIREQFWGFVSFDDCTNERIFTEREESILRSGSLLFAHAYHRNEMISDIKYRDNLLHAVNHAAALLLNSHPDSFENSLHESMKHIADAINVQCVYLWRNHIIDGELYCSQVFEWSLMKTAFANGELYKYNEAVPTWEGILSKGESINGIVSEMSQKEKDHLQPSGIISILVMPIFLEDEFWGFVGFDDHERERQFIKEEEAILHSGNLLIANSFIRNEMLRDIQVSSLKLERALEEATAASRAKSNFLATMSHEIRTPLNAIMGITQIEMQNNDLPEGVESAFRKIYCSSTGLLSIINDILDLSKVETGKMEINEAPYYVPDLIHDCVQLNVVRIGSKSIELIPDISPNLPANLLGDELRIKQILNNLLSNAIKYTSKGFVRLSIKHSCKGDDVELCLKVEDTGQGIKPEDKENLFLEYARFDTKRDVEGTGLGLNIVARLIDMMGGKISVDSDYEKGSTFTVCLPQKILSDEKIGVDVSFQLRKFTYSGETHLASLQVIREPMPYGRVLIVDDVETNLYVAEGLMLPYKLKIDKALSGFSALEKVKSGKKYDIIFMDHMMPKMDGVETTKKLREMGYNGAIVALTANALTGNYEIFIACGFDGFLSKPIDMRELNAILNKYLRDKHPNETLEVEKDEEKNISPLFEIFAKDANRAIKTLHDAQATGDYKLLEITAHAMKSALANVGEQEASSLAMELEYAANHNNTAYIIENIGNFIEILENFAGSPVEEVVDFPEHDPPCISERLNVIMNACESYDEQTVTDILDKLLSEPLTSATRETLKNVREIVYLSSDFDRAMEVIQNEIESFGNARFEHTRQLIPF